MYPLWSDFILCPLTVPYVHRTVHIQVACCMFVSILLGNGIHVHILFDINNLFIKVLSSFYLFVMLIPYWGKRNVRNGNGISYVIVCSACVRVHGDICVDLYDTSNIVWEYKNAIEIVWTQRSFDVNRGQYLLNLVNSNCRRATQMNLLLGTIICRSTLMSRRTL